MFNPKNDKLPSALPMLALVLLAPFVVVSLIIDLFRNKKTLDEVLHEIFGFSVVIFVLAPLVIAGLVLISIPLFILSLPFIGIAMLQ